MATKPDALRLLLSTDSDLDRLLERAQRGDDGAWGALVDRFQRLVYSVPYRYRLGDEDADDVFATTFEALHRNLDRLASGNALPRWLATTAARECLRLLRLRDRTAGSEALEEVVASDDARADAEAIRADAADRVRNAMDRLAARCRDLLGALYAEEAPAYAEIAAALGMPVGAIGPTRARCLDKLRRLVEAEGFFG